MEAKHAHEVIRWFGAGDLLRHAEHSGRYAFVGQARVEGVQSALLQITGYDGDFEEYLLSLDKLLTQGSEPFAFVLDLRKLRSVPSAAHIAQQVQFLISARQLLRERVLWSAIFIERDDVRAVLRKIFDLVPPQRPVHFVDAS
jgi:hypothetical protein